ncbi:unnamed protein product [Protopolystoma xenopodis]|uniref:Uncharacterized protein n=1 Tax=Protopolystoma xenopodis TaxID=117903 RepID=A0A3S5C4F9_9PLAT|nr:unnamed protein product [Protopolystoma xenopodis]
MMDMSALPSNGSEATANTRVMEHSHNSEEKCNPFHQLAHTQHKEANKIECSGVYSTNCKDCEEKYLGETERTFCEYA